MFASLWRLRVFIKPYRFGWFAGIIAFGIARFFETAVIVSTAIAINRITQENYDVLMPVLGIFGAVVARYIVVTYARYAVRKVGLNVAYDLRQQLYSSLQDQGANFYAQHSIGDMMT